jgi:hypothetical protein
MQSGMIGEIPGTGQVGGVLPERAMAPEVHPPPEG